MTIASTADVTKRMYRVDKFTVPNASRSEFLTSVRKTHAFLKTLPGFVQDFILEKDAGPETFNLLTIAEWDSMASFQKAIGEVKAMHQKTNFVKEDRWKRLGITADLGDYNRIAD